VTALVDHWHRTYAANRQVVGTDPDLIHPGQRLVLPPTDQHREENSDHEEHR
jgi:nucleoid-associated protein YgaU